MRGLLLPMDTYDRFVFERRHRKVFEFSYRSDVSGRNDFTRDSNPFLAFAGRCTSAFPFAFEPMQLGDIDAVVTADRFRDAYGGFSSGFDGWRRFFEEYLKPGGAATVADAADSERAEAYRTASFGDGGYLDNKPFSYAIDNLSLRRETVPVDRRMIYVEPDPGDRPPFMKPLNGWREHGPLADLEGTTAERPNALENVQLALLTLPRTEPIREDIQRVIERNRDADRLGEVLVGRPGLPRRRRRGAVASGGGVERDVGGGVDGRAGHAVPRVLPSSLRVRSRRSLAHHHASCRVRRGVRRAIGDQVLRPGMGGAPLPGDRGGRRESERVPRALRPRVSPAPNSVPAAADRRSV